MRKKISKIILSTWLIFMSVSSLFNSEVFAKEWEKKWHCPSGELLSSSGLIKVNDSSDSNYIKTNWPMICIDQNVIDGVLAISIVGEDQLPYCALPSTVGIDGREGKKGRWAEDTIDGECCPAGNPYFFGGKCCPDDDTDPGFGGKCTGGVNPVDIQNSVFMPLQYNPTPLPLHFGFTWATEISICTPNGSGCVVDTSGNLFPGDTEWVNITGLTCLEAGDSLKDYGKPGMVCSSGQAISEDEWVGQTANEACKSLTDPNEVANCLACFQRNEGKDVGTFVYSSLGCVDTSRSGLVTRIFQIGIGLIGGFSIWRIMQAAIMLQQKDPTKHQEARENILAVFWAILVLAGSMVILNFIGFNILGVLAPNAFN